MSHPPSPRGNSRDYVISRLKRDGQTELVDKMMSGQITAAEANRQAGYKKRRIAIALDDADSAAQTILTHMRREDIDALIQRLLASTAERPVQTNSHQQRHV